MGFVRTRIGSDGEPRYLALHYDVKGRQRSAGTFATAEKATRAWQKAEKISDGRLGDARRGRQKFARYVDERWVPHHQMEARTRENYTYYLDKHILPVFGTMRLTEILPVDVREWVTEMKNAGVSPTVTRSCFAILSAIFTTAFNDQLTALHPCRGVKTPPVPKKMRAIVTPAQFDGIYAQLPNDAARLLVETDIETGLRWGELTELRPIDLDTSTRVLTVSRVALELVPKFHPDGGRFLIKAYPKDREHRRLKLNPDVLDAIRTHVKANNIGRKDLLFPLGLLDQAAAAADTTSKLVDFRTDRTQRCRPDGPARHHHCLQHGPVSVRTLPRRVRDLSGRPPRPRQRQPTHTTQCRRPGRAHPPLLVRHHIWQPTLATADLPLQVRPYDLRHAHASWLLAGGADLQIVKERLGHGTITTTEQYLHTFNGADDTALTALSSIRRTAR